MPYIDPYQRRRASTYSIGMVIESVRDEWKVRGREREREREGGGGVGWIKERNEIVIRKERK